jgi:hypothetical protein
MSGVSYRILAVTDSKSELKAGGVAQVVQPMPSKQETLSSNLSKTKNNNNKKARCGGICYLGG